MTERTCTNCGKSSTASIWNKDFCPRCGFNDFASASASASAGVSATASSVSSKPQIIGVLSVLAWSLFAMIFVSGLSLMMLSDDGLLGTAVIIGGVFQLSIFLGFSTIIDQLYMINQNTRKRVD